MKVKISKILKYILNAVYYQCVTPKLIADKDYTFFVLKLFNKKCFFGFPIPAWPGFSAPQVTNRKPNPV